MSLSIAFQQQMRLCHLEASTKLDPRDIYWVEYHAPGTIQRTRERMAYKRGFLPSRSLPGGATETLCRDTFSYILDSAKFFLGFLLSNSVHDRKPGYELRYLFSTPRPSHSSHGRAMSPANKLCLKSLQDGRACEQNLSRALCVCWDGFLLSTLYLLLGRETQICRRLFHLLAVESLLSNSALSPLRTFGFCWLLHTT